MISRFWRHWPIWPRRGTRKFLNKPNKRLKVTSSPWRGAHGEGISPLSRACARFSPRSRVRGDCLAAPAPQPRGARTAILPGRFLNLHFYSGQREPVRCGARCAHLRKNLLFRGNWSSVSQTVRITDRSNSPFRKKRTKREKDTCVIHAQRWRIPLARACHLCNPRLCIYSDVRVIAGNWWRSHETILSSFTFTVK